MHLTDEPGWCLEIKSYPKLTQVGSIGNFGDAARYIDVIPEIDMLGHASAATVLTQLLAVVALLSIQILHLIQAWIAHMDT